MSNYESPRITELGSVADFTRGAGSGPQQDGLYDIFEFIFTGTFEGGRPSRSS
jgi:hypothetical protein